MTRIPQLGSAQRDARLDGAPARLRTRSLMCWRAQDGILAPLNPGISVDYLGRSSAATVYANDGQILSLAAAAPAFSSIDWDGDSVREEDALELSDEEALRYYDETSDELLWPTGAQVWRLDWIERGNALVGDAPYVSLSNDAAIGAWLAVRGTGDGRVSLLHYNGSATVESALAVANGQRCSLRGMLFDDGSVQIGLVKNGASESLGVRSDPIEPAATWGDTGGVLLRLNEHGDGARGVQALRYFAAFRGTATRQQLLEVL